MRTNSPRRKKASNGAGSVYFNEATGRYVAQATLVDAAGRRKRGTWYGKSADEARRKMREAQTDAARGSLTITDGRQLTLAQAARDWLTTARVQDTTRARYTASVDA